MQRSFRILLLAILLMALTVFAGASAEEWYYDIISDTEVKLTGCDWINGSVELPGEIDGRKVTAIGDSAFAYMNDATEIIVPEGVTSIGTYAFSGCESLETISLPDSLESIGEYAFSGCYALEEIEIPDNATELGEYLFNGCKSLVSVTLPEALTSLSNGLFWECTALTTVDIPDTVTSIGDNAFNRCSSLKSLILPDGLVHLGGYLFVNCYNLMELVIPASVATFGEEVFCDCYHMVLYVYAGSPAEEYLQPFGFTTSRVPDHISDGWGYCVLDDGTAMLVQYTGEQTGTLTMPAELDGIPVTALSCGVIAGMDEIHTVIVPESVTALESQTFFANRNLAAVYLPDNCIVSSYDIVYNATFYVNFGSPAYEALYKYYTNSEIGIIGDQTEGDYRFYLDPVEGSDPPRSNAVITAYTGDDENVVIPDTLGGCSVRRIGHSAFIGNTGIKSVTLPAKCASICDDAFRGCTALETVTIPEGAGSTDGSFILRSRAFKDCVKLRTINASVSFSDIYTECFAGCVSLEALPQMDKIELIHFGAFKDCTSLKAAHLGDDLFLLDDEAFMNCTALESVTLAGELDCVFASAFEGCTSLKAITIPASCRSVQRRGFYGCTALETVTIAEGTRIESIYQEAFRNCTSLKSVSIPLDAPLDGFYEYSFAGCTSLASILFPPSVTYIDPYAFDGCDNLIATVVPGSPVAYTCEAVGIATRFPSNSDTVDGFSYTGEGNACIITGYTGEESDLTVPAKLGGMNVIGIGDAVFKDNTVIDTVVVSNGIGFISSEAFSGSSLSAIDLPSSLYRVGGSTFAGCVNLTEIEIPGTLRDLPNLMFDQCTALETVILNEGVESLGSQVFNGCSALETLRLPYSFRDFFDDTFSGCSAELEVIAGSAVEWSFNDYGISYKTYLPDQPIYYLYSYTDDTVGIGYILVNGSDPDVVIPSKINGKKVSTIENNAFDGIDTIETVTVPDSVSNIYTYAFYNCPNLTDVYLPANVEFYQDTFSKNTTLWVYEGSTAHSLAIEEQLKHEVLPSFTCEYNDDGTLVITGTLIDLSGKIFIPAKINDCVVTAIGEGAFKNSAITKLEIPQGVTSIGAEAFAGCTDLRKVRLPLSLSDIGEDAFAGCDELTAYVYINSAAHQYCESNGIKTNVSYAIDYLFVHPGSVYTPVGVSFQPTYETEPANMEQLLAYSSSNESAAVVDENGVITVVGVGNAIITVYYRDNPDMCAEIFVEGITDRVMTVPASVTEIGEEAFVQVEAQIIDLSAASGVKVGPRAFSNCGCLTTILLPEGAEVDMSFIEGTSAVVFTPDEALADEIEEAYGFYTVILK